MDIEDLNDYLVEQITGLSKEQIKSDIKRIHDLRLEVSELDTKLSALTTDSTQILDTNNQLKEEYSSLLKIKQTEAQELAFYTNKIRGIKAELPLLQAQELALNESIESFESRNDEFESRLKAIETKENEILKRELAVKKLSEEVGAQKRTNVIELKKITEAIEINNNLVKDIKLGETPIHKHIQKIQKIMDKKQIKINVLQELQQVVL